MDGIQAGTLSIGTSNNQTATASLTFPTAYGSRANPIVIVTPNAGTNAYNFAATVQRVTATGCVISITRTDTSSGGWTNSVNCFWISFVKG